MWLGGGSACYELLSATQVDVATLGAQHAASAEVVGGSVGLLLQVDVVHTRGYLTACDGVEGCSAVNLYCPPLAQSRLMRTKRST